MYNGQSFSSLNNRTLNNINLPLYKGQGSSLYNIVSPVNLELAQLYIELSYIHKRVFIQDNFNDFLDRRVNEFGVYRKLGTEAIGEVTFEGKIGTKIPNGTIISHSNLLFVVIKDITIDEDSKLNISPIQALEVGIKYNLSANTEFKLIEEITGVTKIYNEFDLKGGTEIETDEELKERFYKIQKNQATSGNKAHYQSWALEVEGVYNAKVIPRWDGPGTIKILIYGQNNQSVDNEVLQRCTEHIEEEKPIGPTVTVVTPSIFDVSISATLTLESGYDIESIKAMFLDIINSYLIENSREIIYIKIMSLLASIEGVHDIKNLLVNDDVKNIIVDEEKVPAVSSAIFDIEVS
ncbi:baseplate J/gp47 family protein [Clostridioides difficile]|uniref:baseplate J/gp47 family protein n=1 Tax=Clostridioides difficile TaxID=1496 RepID=UPI001025E4AA|nr:baseplate J/gp47 family protein [Clostridioides difficile]EGT4968502.1 baseplate J/gp47 family protein [Clostridioides difficile]EIS9859096.1 baseplate J/gp47 family protein [Clostridioides difficile]EJA6764374.1 baseplate J/gp47 family protein [Clostridioides difficile]KAK2209608.1 baseplate protein J [Clostridioides difficile]KAK2221178.1 baseplate protein J [Clostridioides difficile]